ncbi:LysR family transcriptional regulator [Pseudoalteromonas tunicata]|uniref:LysR family transcriptional regulator n=1 Tax=Pseudoalteromonas tunicata TaxID=314281 RepID=UPI00273F2B49|nr:LysR family transcriptional regulator [Pseudoalteromonas tunicata]MDP5213476.1 LysR family transcriptional regulator [Pseudoalteromonas tunicata]
MNNTIYGMIDDLYLLCVVIDLGSITAASTQLAVPTSTVSRRICELEAKLNARLLTKQGRNVIATDFGLTLYQDFQGLFNHLSDDLLTKKALHDDVQGRVKLVVPALFYRRIIREPLLHFLTRYPKVELELVLSEERIQPTLDTDLIITFNQNIDPNLIARPLIAAQYATFASPSFINENPNINDIKQLAKCKWIATSRDKIEFYQQHKKVAELTNLNLTVVNSIEAVIDFVSSGLGVASLPLHLTKNNPQLVRIMPHYHQPEKSGYLVYKERKYQSKATRILIELLIAEGSKLDVSIT